MDNGCSPRWHNATARVNSRYSGWPHLPLLTCKVGDGCPRPLIPQDANRPASSDRRRRLAVVNEWTALGVVFISLGEGIDATTPAGTLQLYILGALAQFERGRLRERVLAGLAGAKREGRRLGRRRTTPVSEDAPRG
jgi:hypothetical protein